MALLAGRVAVVTGGAQGLGYAIAEAFIAEGARVLLGDLDTDATGAAAEALGGSDVARALAELPAAQREIMQLHLTEGFSFREAGRITGVSMFTAASRYRVALERLRQLMGKR